MDNKNGKTFGDLFSSSTSESNSEGINFEKLTDRLSENEKKEESMVTFDHLFDQVAKEESVVEENKIIGNSNQDNFQSLFQTGGSIFDADNHLKENTDLTSGHEVETPVEVGNSENFSTLNSLFNKKTSVLDSKLKSSDSIFGDSSKSEIVNSVLDSESVKKEELNEEDGSLELRENDFKESSIFDSESLDNESSDSGFGDLLKSQSQNSVFDLDSEKKEDTKNEFVSPFLESTPQEEKTNFSSDVVSSESSLFEQSSENNRIFDNVSIFSDKKSDLLENSNPFLLNDENEKKNIVSMELPSDSVESVKSESNLSVSNNENISPFFVENISEEVNPLFLEKINLIENEENNKRTSNIDTLNTNHFDVKIVKKKEPLFKMILGVISYAIFIWLLLIGVALLVYVLDIKIRAAKGDYSAPMFNAYVVLTGSMLPEIEVYDVVVTKKTDPSELEERDVITFASADTRFLNTIITHRIIKKNYDSETKTYSFQTKGDNNNVADNALVPQNNIYGKVILKIPKLGYLQEFLASDGGWIIVILIPCLTVICYDIVKLAKGLKRKKYKNIKVQK